MYVYINISSEKYELKSSDFRAARSAGSNLVGPILVWQCHQYYPVWWFIWRKNFGPGPNRLGTAAISKFGSGVKVISRPELKILIEPICYFWEKNVINTINWAYKKADLKKKKFLNFDFFPPQNGQKHGFWVPLHRGPKRHVPVVARSKFFVEWSQMTQGTTYSRFGTPFFRIVK